MVGAFYEEKRELGRKKSGSDVGGAEEKRKTKEEMEELYKEYMEVIGLRKEEVSGRKM